MSDKDEKETGSMKLAGCVFGVLLQPVEFLVWGNCAALLYLWYVVPIWPSVPRISAAYFVGLKLLASLWRRSSAAKDQDVIEAVSESAMHNIILPPIILLMGWFVKIWWIQ